MHEFHTHFCIPLAHALAYRQLETQATRVALTGLGNRAAFDEQVARQLGQLKRHDAGFGLLVVDLDNFKRVNDTLGHHEGDAVLTALVKALSVSLRDEDVAFRFGGDEFCCLLNTVDTQQLVAVAQRIGTTINSDAFL